MKFSMVVLLILLGLMAMFTVQNPDVVTVRFLGFAGNTLMLVVIVASFAAGVVGAGLAAVPSYFRRRTEVKEARRKTRELEGELARLKAEIEQLRAKAAPPPGTTPQAGSPKPWRID